MTRSFFAPPARERYALRRIHVPRALLSVDEATRAKAANEPELCSIDMLIDRGRIAAIEPAGTFASTEGPDLDDSLVLPGLIDCHAHLDKGHIAPRLRAPSRNLHEALASTALDRQARWSADDLRLRMGFGLACAYAHGVVAIRTHLDALAPQAAVSFAVFEELRAQWAGRIELQAASIVPLDVFLTEVGRDLADTVAAVGGRLGCATRFAHRANTPEPPELDIALGHLFQLAAERGLDLDLHVDETADRDVLVLRRIAEMAIRRRFPNRILCGHCCSLALQTDELIEATLVACADARIDIVSLPTVNLYLQDRHAGRTPRWRGVTLLHEMAAHGLRVAVAGDNCRDPFHAHGDHDMLDTYAQAVRICQLDAPLGEWIKAACATPAALMGLDRGTLAVGRPADLLVLKARDQGELFARHSVDRTVLRDGKAIDTSLPDFRLLDAAMRP